MVVGMEGSEINTAGGALSGWEKLFNQSTNNESVLPQDWMGQDPLITPDNVTTG